MDTFFILSIVLAIVLILVLVVLSTKLSNSRSILKETLRKKETLFSDNKTITKLLQQERTKVSNLNTEVSTLKSKLEAKKEVESTIPLSNSYKGINKPKSITQKDANGGIIAKFTSLRDASKSLKISRYKIKKACESGKLLNNFKFSYN